MCKSPSNIYIIGAQSTGKTTLVDALVVQFAKRAGDAEHSYPNPSVIKEVARGVLHRHDYTASDIVSSKSRALELQHLILEAQAEAEQAACKQSWYISDRSGIDPLVYARRYVGPQEACGLIQSQAWQFLEQRMREAVIILCEAGGEWLIDDGVRLMPEDRAAWMHMHADFIEMLDGLAIEYYLLPASLRDLDQRVSFVVERWDSGRDTG